MTTVLLAATAVALWWRGGREALDHLTPPGCDPAPPAGDRPGIRVHPGRDPE